MLNYDSKAKNNFMDAFKKASNKKVIDPVDESLGGDEYLPSFVSTPSFGKNNIATFDNIAIYNNKNKKVNVLQINHTYKLHFTVKFNRSEEDIFFGAEFYTLKGFLISGLDTKRYTTNKVYSVKKDNVFEVTIEFNCALLPEVYLINIFANYGDSGLTIRDAYIFKVTPSDWFQSGLVNLKQKIEVKKIEN